MSELQSLVDRWNDLLGPNPYLQAALTVVLFLVLGKVAELLARVLLSPLLRARASTLPQQITHTLTRPVFVTVFVFGLMIATTIVAPGARSEWVILAVLKTILVVVWIGFGLRASELILFALGRRVPPPAFVQPGTTPLLRILMMITAFMIGAYAILLAWDVNVTGLVASAGILGLAVSFAAQDTLGNIVAGISILADKPYRIGDYIVLDTGERGAVIHVGLRSTRLLTRDDVEVSIPNGIMGKAKIVNESGGPVINYRLRVPVRVAYGTDIDQAMNLMLELAAVHPTICDSPEPRVRLRSLGESELNFELLAWISNPAERGLVVHELNCQLYKAFHQADIRIPFPQRDLHVRDWPADPGAVPDPLRAAQ